MNAHYEAQTVIESLSWLAQNTREIDVPTAAFILEAEGQWAIVLDAAKKRLNVLTALPAPAPVPSTALPTALTQMAAKSAPAATPAPNSPQIKPNHTRPRRLAGM